MASEEKTELQSAGPAPAAAPPLSEADSTSSLETKDQRSALTSDDQTAVQKNIDLSITQKLASPEIIDHRGKGQGEGSGTLNQGPEAEQESSWRSLGKPKVTGYKILDLLGRGTYGEVWKAQEESTGIEVAIKFFAHGTGQQWQLLQAEVKQLALLQADPGIVQLKDVEPSASPPYYVMALAEKGCLAKRLAKGPVPVAEALNIFRQVADTLAYVHAKGIRHCDLKPGNVLLDARGRARVADFGQAHLSTDASPALGTFFYMAPEQADLKKQIPDTRWDVYGLGAIFYAMVVGQPPRQDPLVRNELAGTGDLSHRLDRYRAWVDQAPPLAEHRRVPGMDRDLAEIIDRCLEIDPAKRWHDAGAVLTALARRDRQRRLRPFLLFALVAPVLLLLIMAAVVSRMISPLQKNLTSAQAELSQKVNQRNLYLARLLGEDVEVQLHKRIQVLEKIARQPALAQALKAARKDDLRKILETHLPEWQEDKDKSLFVRVLVTLHTGEIQAIIPEVDLPEPNYGYRDWFHGGGDQPKNYRGKPVSKTYISQPFVSTVAGHPLMIAISTPVWDPDRPRHPFFPWRRPLGVVSATIELATIQGWFSELNLPHSFAVLLNERGQFLFHQDTEKIKPIDEEAPRSFPKDSALFDHLLARQEAGITAQPISDPINGKKYWASYAPVNDKKIGWGVVIQHEQPTTEILLAELNRTLITTGLIALGVFALVIPALWGWLRWMLRKEEGNGA